MILVPTISTGWVTQLKTTLVRFSLSWKERTQGRLFACGNITLADYTLCLGANGGSNAQSVLTVSCSNEFIAPAQLGDLVEGHAKVLKRGGSIVFVRCELRVNEKIILNSSGVIKRIRLES